ncbi:glutathione S-transferase C-terminal domain-containing protein homolog [Plutella xylostella]|uniref:glutathione S-transferase C-terminal domain-containing protein homolog n=1 Tax=Plutella xylostella TaxID=51655 RepID=UPI002032A87C|nr:glutathione S-transferase C-terminal domain-containing protein homolog [Plutella xylostella]
MHNAVYLKSYSDLTEFEEKGVLKLRLESLVTFCIYTSCSPKEVNLFLIPFENDEDTTELSVQFDGIVDFIAAEDVPWSVALCSYPVVFCEDTVVTGLCAVARHICKYRTTSPSPQEHEEGLLGFRKSCLQAPNEVSIWTKFCEVDLFKTVSELLSITSLQEIPSNLVRFENHLNKPVRIHNVYKVARNIKKESLDKTKDNENVNTESKEEKVVENRKPKTRKWKSNTKKELEVDCSTKIEDLDVNHQFAEGPFLTLADLILLPLYYIITSKVSESTIESILPLTHKWYKTITSIPEFKTTLDLLRGLNSKPLCVENISCPEMSDVSLYKCDPKRHNPKKRLFTKEDDIENALSALVDGMELNVQSNDLEIGTIKWNDIPEGANPTAGHLPDDRMARKTQQLENLALAVMSISADGDLIVDFCCGSGHLGILLAYLLPKCTIILLENKEQSLMRARKRVHEMGLKNVYFYQCNLDFFIGKFDVGIGLHACGIASDLVLDKCLKANAKFVLCPCCYGSLHATDRLVYPRSSKYEKLPIDKYLCIGHAADQTHEDHPLAVRGARCMAVIDSDRGHLALESGYKVTLSKLTPLSCTPKNNLLVGIPS